jgi:hypothetical protein
VTTRPDHGASASDVKAGRRRATPKRNKNEKEGPIFLEDPFQIWLHVMANKNINGAGDDDDDDDKDLYADIKTARTLDKSKGQVWLPADAADIPHVIGGKLSQLCVGGLLKWVEERNNDRPSAKNIPSGSSDELEGQLAEQSITLCE